MQTRGVGRILQLHPVRELRPVTEGVRLNCSGRSSFHSSQYWPIGQYWQLEIRQNLQFICDGTREPYVFAISNV